MKINLNFFRVLQIFLVSIITIAFISSFGYSMYQDGLPEALYIKDVKISINGGSEKTIALPYSIKGLTPGTPVAVTANIRPTDDDLIYIKTAYAPAKVYIDNMIIYELGKKETYPSFMIDPATEIYLIKPSANNKEVEFKMEFLSPTTRNTMTIYPPIMATFKSIFYELLKSYKISFFFSIAQLSAGVFLAVTSLVLLFFEKRISSIFFWLGMFSFTSGLWTFGECNFTALMIKNPTMLYVFAFIGLFTVSIPLIHLGIVSVNFKNPKPLYMLSSFQMIASAIAIVLQLAKLYPLSSSMYIFHFITPCSLCIFLFFTIYEAIKYDNLHAKRFTIPILILTVSSLIEVVNYYFRFTYKLATLFQDGVIIFLLAMGFIIGVYIKDIAIMRKENEKLAFEMELMSIQIDEQRKYNELIAENESALKKQKHDLRHHLIAIRELAEVRNEKLCEYLDSLIENIPSVQEVFCENKWVNAIISHYSAICKEEHISFNTNLLIPEMNTATFDSDLCIIFGNLLENAIEACKDTTSGEKFISISSNLHFKTLVITMDNSFNGIFISENGRIRSTKRNDFGIGLSSISSVAKKYGGDANFEGKNGIFQSSVYLQMHTFNIPASDTKFPT